MKCSDFLARFSEFYDGDPDLPDREAFRDHVENCPDCARYTNVVREGGEELRSLPQAKLRGDFRPRLQHRLYHLDDETRLPVGSTSSATPAAAVALVAVVVAVVAWYPALQPEDPSVDMPVIVVHEPPAEEATSSTDTEAPSATSSSRALPPNFERPGFYDEQPLTPPEGFLAPTPGNLEGPSGSRLLQMDYR